MSEKLSAETELFLEQVEAAYLLRKKKIRQRNKRINNDYVTLGKRLVLKNVVTVIQCLHIFISLCLLFCMDIKHNGAFICLSTRPKLLDIISVIIAGVIGVFGTLLDRPAFILVFLFLQVVILFYVISDILMMVLIAIVLDETLDKLFFITNISFGITYALLLFLVFMYWRLVSSANLPRMHKTESVAKRFKSRSWIVNELFPMTPEIRVHNPAGKTELVVPTSPMLPIYTNSFICDESPVIFPEYKQSCLR